MTKQMVCPQCGGFFADDDYCPVHGLRLVAAKQPEAKPSAQSEPSKAEEGPTQGAGHADASANAEEPPRAEPPPRTERPAGAGGSAGAGAAPAKSRMDDVLRKFGARKPADAKEPPQARNGDDTSTGFRESSPLPVEVRKKGWRITGAPKSRAGVDRWPVECRATDGSVVTGRFLRYRTGALTTAPLYERIENCKVDGLVRVWQHGTLDLDGARADYELCTLPKGGVSLMRFLRDSAPAEQRALRLLALLSALLGRLEAAGLHPLALEPRVLQLTQDGEVWLAMAGALTGSSSVAAFRPEVDHSPLLPGQWTAPELTQSCMTSASTAVFSVGQVLAMAAWGEPCSLEELRTGGPQFKALADSRLARVLMGCLWPRAEGRWQPVQLAQAVAAASLEEMPAAPPWASLTPGASSSAFALAGECFWRLDDLLAAAVDPANWQEAVARLDAILGWAKDTAWAGQAKLMQDERRNGRSPDWVLVALVRAAMPGLPVTWRGLDFSDANAEASLVALAQGVLNGSEANAKTMQDLIDADLRDAYAHGVAGR